jgi:hypothetical protein
MSRKSNERGGSKLRAVRVADVPLEEVSGICLRRDRDGRMAIIAIGDRVARAAYAVLTGDDTAELSWETRTIEGLQGTRLPERDPQIEAVCADGEGRVLLLQETPARAEFVDPVKRTVITSIELDVGSGHPLSGAWQDPDGSRGEGAVLLPNGHLLVAKEKRPTALLEFGPVGEAPAGFRTGSALRGGAGWPVAAGDQSFVPLATWMPDASLRDACKDFSDLEVGPDGHLYLLSDKSGTLARVGDLDPESNTASAETVWRLGKLDGKPEGLAFTANGRAVVALDTRKARHNLVLFEPPIAPAGPA